jgi:hypothetical protein
MPVIRESEGTTIMEAQMIGELVKVPDPYRDRAENLVGELNMGLFPFGIDVALAPPQDHLNGLWVQREILNYLVRSECETGKGRAA